MRTHNNIKTRQPSRILIAAAFATIIPLMASAATEDNTGVELLDHIIAVINDDIITQYRFEQEIARLEQGAPRSAGIDFESERIRNQVLQKMIDDNLVLQMATRAGIVIDELTMDSYMRQMARTNGKSLTEFRDEIIKTGLTFDEFRERIREDLIRQRMIYGYVVGRIVVLDEEIEKYLKKIPEFLDDEFLVSRILIRSREFDSTKRRTEELKTLKDYERSRESGTPFEELISRFSNDPNRINDGDLGWVTARNMPAPYLDVLLKMGKGEVSEPLVLASGIHILKLRDVRRRNVEMKEELLLQRILIDTRAEHTPEHSKIKVDFIYEQLQKGVDFERLAQQYSDDVASSPAGGDIGWTTEGDIPPQLWQVVSNLRPNEFTVPVLTPFGWEIARLRDRRRSDQTETLRRERVRNNIIESRLESELITWLREVRGSAYIEIVDTKFEPLEDEAPDAASLLNFSTSDELSSELPGTSEGDLISTEQLD